MACRCKDIFKISEKESKIHFVTQINELILKSSKGVLPNDELNELEKVKEIGVDYAQGYYFAKSSAEIIKII
ncbi:MAG: hypothetical protein PHE16_03560 [Aliarcobacter sp.]|nr:hypothetical protein [Aliarcobacter sp.]